MSQTIGEALLAYQNENIIEKMSKNAAIKAELELIQEYTSDKILEEAHDRIAKYCLESEPCDVKMRKDPIYQAVREVVA
tara:strand:- start:1152 stop:1388 length:237 start_codon:yes stop_codon:yes gene_type:complete